jgi:prophage DNA circulation protein
MKKPIGTDLIQGVQDLLDAQMGTAQGKKQDETFEALGDFARKYGIPVEAGPVNSLARVLRNKGAEVNRQVRTLSDALLLKDERELEKELELLREKLSKVEATFHQVKTKTAFVYTVLRPFSEKYRVSWFPERKDIDVDQANSQIMRLENAPVESENDITFWAKEVADLFEQLVVYRGEDVADFYSRPSGTVSEKSSRTYLQAWATFIEKYRDEIWELAISPELLG